MAAPIYKGGRPFFKGGIRFPNSVVFALQGSGAPTDAVTGAAVAGKGSIYVDYASGSLYTNVGTKASPTWTKVDTAAGLALTNGHIFVGSASNLPADVAMSGDVTITNAGVTAIKTSVALTTPDIGVATATSVNKVAITAPASSATVTIANGKTLTVSNTITFAGTDSTTMTFPSTSATIARTDAGNTFTGNQAVTGSVLSSSPTAGLGYSTGAGGTGTQGTDKSTTVTLSPSAVICGAVTTTAAQLNAATIVSFDVTNTAVVATDRIIVNHVSGGTLGAYTINAQPGSSKFTINLRNNTAGALSEALVIGFAVVKGVTA